jgi:hypothetical protein
MKSIGINTSVDGPHSTRSVASSHAMMVLGDDSKVASHGRWSSPATFHKFYNKASLVQYSLSVSKSQCQNMADVMRSSMPTAKFVNAEAKVTQLSANDRVVFKLGYWKDFPSIAVTATVFLATKTKYQMICDCDNSTVTISVQEAGGLLKSGGLTKLKD